MSMLINDPVLSAHLIEQRRARGADHHDEVWEGVYVMSPLANNEHQELIAGLTAALREAIDRQRLGRSFPGVNLATDPVDWQRNYRCPDVAVYLHSNPAQDCGTHWVGGPDLAIEIVSQYDRSREKIGFYERVGTRELLIVDRDPWQLELLRLEGNRLTSVGVAGVGDESSIVSESTRLAFRLVPGPSRPVISVRHCDDGRCWEA